MGRYASETPVSVEKSRADIEQTLVRYGATEFHSGWQEGRATIGFRIDRLFIRFVLPIPKRTEQRFTQKKNRYGHPARRTEAQAEQAWQQEVRQRWRALLLTIKAKLEAVECGISSLESEFLAFVVMPNQVTVGDWVMDQCLPAIRENRMPQLLLAGPKAGDVQDAVVVEPDRTEP